MPVGIPRMREPTETRRDKASALRIDTPRGRARVELRRADDARGALVLGHGAGGGIHAKDLQAVARAVVADGWSVALVEQPYRVAGRRSPPPASHLDEAWEAIVARLARKELAGLAIVTGGRSSGARVACRAATATGAIGVVCLAFPLQPPSRRDGSSAPSRLPELAAVEVPVLVVQGESDPFGMPRAARNRRVVRVPGNHSLSTHLDDIGRAVCAWLATL